jgi:hypothetical protein
MGGTTSIETKKGRKKIKNDLASWRSGQISDKPVTIQHYKLVMNDRWDSLSVYIYIL